MIRLLLSLLPSLLEEFVQFGLGCAECHVLRTLIARCHANRLARPRLACVLALMQLAGRIVQRRAFGGSSGGGAATSLLGAGGVLSIDAKPPRRCALRWWRLSRQTG